MYNHQFSGLSTKIFIFPLINRHIFIMPIPFGFSVGDFITLISLAIKICQALDESSDILKEYQDVRQELQSFRHAVEGLENAVSRGYAISERSAEKLHDILRGCTQALNEFEDFFIFVQRDETSLEEDIVGNIRPEQTQNFQVKDSSQYGNHRSHSARNAEVRDFQFGFLTGKAKLIGFN